ncbi:DTW domain-containing protein [Paraneptunicella aestuarii]|uniref:tRNA-uridine aminocarboxypropyltransferase n=1 Tax=Paraneptunicella aestuarii TaxID=2831148 RepID=UPI001E3858EF|nr:tRNA-uridine aminocarboxypropyltransferase [Paraneptunicella aestuarii]UAA39772.1 DTW domain-containing protein [Paraneptunicella aestuarii]
MSQNVRKECPKCLRPQKTCLCSCITSIDNHIELGILQHPNELGHSKGTAIIAQLSLNKVRHWMAEDVAHLVDFHSWMASGSVYLLYPPTEDDTGTYQTYTIRQLADLSDGNSPEKSHFNPIKVLMLDATWRKSYKMMQVNPILQQLDRVILNPAHHSGYLIRKQKNERSLSSIEAIYELLSQLESDPDKYQPLLDAFAKMQQTHLSYRRK